MLTPLVSSLTNPIPALVPAAWFRGGYGVTGTLTASNWADQSGNGRDLAQATGGNQPIYLPYSGTPYAYLPGVAGNYFSTPDSAASSITGDIDIRIRVALNDWASGTQQPLASKYDAGNVSYRLIVDTGNKLQLVTSADGSSTISYTSTAAPSAASGAMLWVRVTLDVDNGAAGKTATFYTSTDTTNASSEVTWTQLGSAVTSAGTTSIYNSTVILQVGSEVFDSLYVIGKIYRAQIYNGINGTLAVDFNPSDFAETCTNGATAVSSGTGETWTLNSTGAKPARITKSPMLVGDGTNHKMATSNFTLNQAVEHFMVVQPISWTAADYMLSGTVAEAGITQVTGTPQIGLNAGSAAAANSNAALGSFCIIHAAINGASSSLTVNNGTAATGNAGANNPGGITLFSNQAGTGYFNGAVKELVTFGALSAADRVRVFNWLNYVHHCY